MIKRILSIIILIMFFWNFSLAQEKPSNEQIRQIKNDTNKVNYLNKLAWDYKNNDSLARSYALIAKELSDSISFDKGLSTSLMRLGVLEKNKDNYELAIEYYLKSLTIEDSIHNKRGIVRAKFQLAKIHQKIADYDNALKYCSEAVVDCSQMNDEKLLASIYSLLSSIYLNLNSFELSLEAQHESIKIRVEIKDEKNLAKSCLNIGILYNRLRKKEEAVYYLNKSKYLYEQFENKIALSKVYIGIGYNYVIQKNLDSALIYYNKSLAIKSKLNLNKEVVLNNIGGVYEAKDDFDKANQYYQRSIELAENQNNEEQLLISYYNLGRLYRKQGNNKLALKYLNKSLLISEKHKDDLTRLELLMTVAETYESLKDFKKASSFNEKHIILRDSVDARYRAVAVVQSKYQKEKRKNELLIKEKEINQEKNFRVVAENNKKTIQLYALVGAVVLLALLFFAVFYGYKTKKAKELAEKNQKLEVQKNIELLKKQELKSIKAMINGQESERKRIAQDLHDRLGSMLTVVKLNYKSIGDSLDELKEENKKQYSQANALLDEACDTVREIAHNMVSGVLTKFGLVAALEDLKNTIKGTNTFELELITHGLDDRLENNLEMELYGIIQELIHNIIKHAKAKEVSVQLLKRIDGINLTVIDDGVGFDSLQEPSNSGMGLKSVASRVNSLDGIFHVDSGKGNGTTINIDIPL